MDSVEQKVKYKYQIVLDDDMVLTVHGWNWAWVHMGDEKQLAIALCNGNNLSILGSVKSFEELGPIA